MVSFATHADADIFEPLGHHKVTSAALACCKMPTARMAKTGEFSVNYVDDDQYRRWSMSVQPFNWLEATLRYTDVRTRLYSANSEFSGDQTYKTRAWMSKSGCWKSLPGSNISLGFRDLMGTGLFDSEYVVGSKRVGRLTSPLVWAGGIWGKREYHQPFCEWKNDWCSRDNSYSSGGGKFETKICSMVMLLVWGVEYQTPWQPLRLKLEYDGNDYSNEFAGKIDHSSPINIGAVYRLFDYMDTHLSYRKYSDVGLLFGPTLMIYVRII